MMYVDNLIPNVNIPIGEKGDWKILKRSFTGNELHNIINRIKHNRYIPEGEYTFLEYHNETMMSDTPDEKTDHRYFVQKAKGNVLIAGLGLGMVLQAVALKPEVDYVTVIEISQDLIDLVGPYYLNNELYRYKINIICADIFEWKPSKNIYYDVAWYDIWKDICEDNLIDMIKLHRKFGKKVDWQDSWQKSYLKYLQKNKNRY
jgi:hypothetical protein